MWYLPDTGSRDAWRAGYDDWKTRAPVDPEPPDEEPEPDHEGPEGDGSPAGLAEEWWDEEKYGRKGEEGGYAIG